MRWFLRTMIYRILYYSMLHSDNLAIWANKRVLQIKTAQVTLSKTCPYLLIVEIYCKARESSSWSFTRAYFQKNKTNELHPPHCLVQCSSTSTLYECIQDSWEQYDLFSLSGMQMFFYNNWKVANILLRRMHHKQVPYFTSNKWNFMFSGWISLSNSFPILLLKFNIKRICSLTSASPRFVCF